MVLAFDKAGTLAFAKIFTVDQFVDLEKTRIRSLKIVVPPAWALSSRYYPNGPQ